VVELPLGLGGRRPTMSKLRSTPGGWVPSFVKYSPEEFRPLLDNAGPLGRY
jgi:hypothetical protein